MEASISSDMEYDIEFPDLEKCSDCIYDYYVDSPYFVGIWSGEHIVAGLSIALFAIPGLSAYLTVIIAILRNPQTFANKSYYTLLLSLAFCDMLQSVGCLLYAMPCILTQKRVYGEQFDRIYGSVGCGMLFYIGLANVILIAINRYFAVYKFAIYQRFFQTNRVRIYLLLSWIFGILSTVAQLFPGLEYRFYPHWYTWGFDPLAWRNIYSIWYNRVMSAILFLILVYCYTAILIKRPAKVGAIEANSIDKSAKTKREKSERNLALQFFLISAIFLSYLILNQINISNRFYSLFLTLYYIVFINCNPFIYLIFNSDIRQHVLSMMGKTNVVKMTTLIQSTR